MCWTYLDNLLTPLQSKVGVKSMKRIRYGTTSCPVVGNCHVALWSKVVKMHLQLRSRDNTCPKIILRHTFLKYQKHLTRYSHETKEINAQYVILAIAQVPKNKPRLYHWNFRFPWFFWGPISRLEGKCSRKDYIPMENHIISCFFHISRDQWLWGWGAKQNLTDS